MGKRAQAGQALQAASDGIRWMRIEQDGCAAHSSEQQIA